MVSPCAILPIETEHCAAYLREIPAVLLSEAWRKFSRYRVLRSCHGGLGIKSVQPSTIATTPAEALANFITSGYPTLILRHHAKGSDRFILILQLPVPKLPHSTNERCKDSSYFTGLMGVQTGGIHQCCNKLSGQSRCIHFCLHKAGILFLSLAMLCRSSQGRTYFVAKPASIPTFVSSSR